MKKKRVCIDVNPIVGLYVRGYLSGIGRTTLELVQALSQVENNTLDITLWSHNTKGIGVKNLPLLSGTHFFYPNRENWNKILGRFPIRELFTQYDLLHVTHNFEYVYAPQKTIVTLHDALFMKMQESIFEHERMRNEVPPLMRACKAIITCSDCSKNDIVETMGVDPDKIHVIPWGIRHDVFYPLPDKNLVKEKLKQKFELNRPYFFSVSCNTERKNTLGLIEAYICLANAGWDVDLCLVWNAPASIRELVEKEEMSERIHFIPTVDDTDLNLLYNGALATAFPSFYEGFGLPVLESMACGTPVISSNTSSLPEVGGDVPVYIDPKSVDALTDAMRGIVQNDFDREALSQKGVERAKSFTWARCAQATIDVYKKYLNE